MVINSIKAEVAQRLTVAGQPPRVLTASAIVGAERARSSLNPRMMSMAVGWLSFTPRWGNKQAFRHEHA